MSGLEAAIVPLGVAVVKSAARTWLGDRALAADVSASAVDALAGRLAGVVERCRAKRLFEQMEEVVAERLAPLVEAEFRGLSGNERLADKLASLERVRSGAESLGEGGHLVRAR